ncbi:MAG: hypothetical protein IIA59_06600 [Candidatus Marinimicrobia bacterium]|nr:hypothetical protein [Candidatus Neomarinimicrobiota bacterium]
MNSLLAALMRAVQFLALVSVPYGLYVGNRNRDMTFELATLTIGAAVFYLASLALQDGKK